MSSSRRVPGRSLMARAARKAGRTFRAMVGLPSVEDREKWKGFAKDFALFSRMAAGVGDTRFEVSRSRALPKLEEKTETTPFDSHYVYHTAWAARLLAEARPEVHHDFASDIRFATLVSAFIPLVFHDYRPLRATLEGLECRQSDLTRLALEDGSLKSISCMHVIEHVGLGRYGDPVDPRGDLRAIGELRRVLGAGGDMYFVVPVGKPSLRFNAHRIYSFQMVIDCFPGLELKDFSLVTDGGAFVRGARPDLAWQQEYGCGCFWFRKPA